MKKNINTKHAPQPIGPYVQGIQKNNIIVTSGQIPLNEKNQIISENISIQTKQSLQNIKNIIETAGFKVNDIIKITIFLTNIKYLEEMNRIYENFFIQNKSTYPARTCVEVSRLPKNVKIEIEAIAIQ